MPAARARVREPDEPGDDLRGVAACGDVVGADVEHDVGRARQLGDLAGEPGLRARRPPPAVGQELVAGDAGVEHGHRRGAAAAGQAVDSASDQRASVSGPLPTPSVIESPIATTALTGRGASTSTPVSTSHDADRRGERVPSRRTEAPGGEIGGLQRDRVLGDDVRRAGSSRASPRAGGRPRRRPVRGR